ncbi:MAG: hypothetical protein KGS72_19505 [Cyanobacteria bacterium REEB67]|nr:hypothetical protein [Cyanobacteria bacterium REEB67]
MSDRIKSGSETKIDARPIAGHEHGLFSSMQGANNMDMMMLGKQALPLPEAFTKGAGGKANDLQIVDEKATAARNSDPAGDQIARSIAEARAQMTPAQLQHAEMQASAPMRYIQAAGEFKHQAPEQKLTAHAGDTLSAFAALILRQREGHAPSQAHIIEMTDRLAIHNNKTNVNDLKVGEIISVPLH